MLNPIERLKNLWFWSGVSAKDVQDNPHSFVAQALLKQSDSKAYIVGLSEEESSFADSLNANGLDTKLN
jgi:hypothetical protein